MDWVGWLVGTVEVWASLKRACPSDNKSERRTKGKEHSKQTQARVTVRRALARRVLCTQSAMSTVRLCTSTLFICIQRETQ